MKTAMTNRIQFEVDTVLCPASKETQLRARGKFTFQGRSVSRADFLATVGEKIPALQPRLRDTTGRWQVIIHTRRMYEIDPAHYDEEDVIRTLKISQRIFVELEEGAVLQKVAMPLDVTHVQPETIQWFDEGIQVRLVEQEASNNAECVCVRDLSGNLTRFTFGDKPVGEIMTMQLKALVSRTHGLRPEETRLMFAGRQLAEGQPLARYGVRSGDKLQLAPMTVRWPLRNPHGHPVLVTVRLPYGAVVTVTVPLCKANTIAYLVSSIHFATLQTKFQSLRFDESSRPLTEPERAGAA